MCMRMPLPSPPRSQPPRHKPQPPAPEPTGACVKYNPNPSEPPPNHPRPHAPPHISLPSPLQSHRNPRFDRSTVPCPRAPTHRPTEAAAAEPAMARRVAPTTGARIAPLFLQRNAQGRPVVCGVCMGSLIRTLSSCSIVDPRGAPKAHARRLLGRGRNPWALSHSHPPLPAPINRLHDASPTAFTSTTELVG